MQTPAASGGVTIPDPSDTLGEPVVERTLQQLVVTTCRVVASRSVPGSGVTAPYRTSDDTGRVELSSKLMKKPGAANATKPAETSKASDRKIKEMLMKKVSHVFNIQKNNQVKNSFTGFPETDMRAFLKQSMRIQQFTCSNHRSERRI